MIVLSFKKSFGHVTIEGEFTFERGFNVVFGPSGAGKSTVIKVMCGIEKPDEGYMKCCEEIFFDTEKGIFLPPQRRKLGVVFQTHNLFPHMTVKENIEFALKKAKNPQFTVEELLEKFKLKGYEDKYPEELSGGQRQRVAIIRAIVFNPRAVLMDEPFSSLDFKTKLSIMDFIKGIHIDKPVVIVTHDPFEALYLGDKFFLMENGKKVKEGGKEVLKEYADLEKLKKFLD